MFTPQFFRFDPALIENGTWASLPLASKAIFYPLAAHADRKGRAFPSEETIRRLSGYKDLGAVKAGVKGFRKAGVVKVHTRQAGPRKTKNYYMLPIPAPDAKAIHLISDLIKHQQFVSLSPIAKALYLPLRHISRYPDFDDLVIAERVELNNDGGYLDNWVSELCEEGRSSYSWRPYNVIEYEGIDFNRSKLAELSGIHRNSISSAIDELCEHGVLWRGEDGALICVCPLYGECMPQEEAG